MAGASAPRVVHVDPHSSPCGEAVAVGPHRLPGVLESPVGATALVLFAHGSGSSHRSARNRHVAEALHRAGLATLRFDLLSEAEAADRAHVFDIALLAARLVGAIDWAAARPALAALPLGLFGASTGAAAALVAAAARPRRVRAVVSRGGRPDLAADAWPQVRVPTLLIVGGDDREVLQLNRAALRGLAALGERARLEIVPGATHLFEEPGALDAVATLAADWFARHLSAGVVP